jgi:hypothetical protein
MIETADLGCILLITVGYFGIDRPKASGQRETVTEITIRPDQRMPFR